MVTEALRLARGRIGLVALDIVERVMAQQARQGA